MGKILGRPELEDDRWRHSLGDQTRILGDKDFPVPKDWECSGKVLKKLPRLWKLGHKEELKEVKILFLSTTFCWMYCYP